MPTALPMGHPQFLYVRLAVRLSASLLSPSLFRPSLSLVLSFSPLAHPVSPSASPSLAPAALYRLLTAPLPSLSVPFSVPCSPVCWLYRSLVSASQLLPTSLPPPSSLLI